MQFFGGDIISSDSDGEKFRMPVKSDGSKVWKLVKDTGVLDLNSSYSYLMWCEYFGETSIVAQSENKVVGFISAFIEPDSPDKLFVWQVAVAKSERGKGLASDMLHQLLTRDRCEHVHYVETTITPSNIPSQKLFHRLARDLSTEIYVSKCFTRDDFPEKGHEDELLHLIGPFKKN